MSAIHYSKPDSAVWFATASSFIHEIDLYILLDLFLFLIATWLCLEICFAVMIRYVLHPRLQKTSDPQTSTEDPSQFILRILDSVDSLSCYSIESYISGFFRGADFHDVYKDNIRSFLSWAMYAKHKKDLREEEAEKLEHIFEELRTRYPGVRNCKDGYNPKVKHVSMSLDPVPFVHRPLILYVAISLGEILCNAVFFRACGFQSLQLDGTSYWYRPRRRTRNDAPVGDQLPMVFFHGIAPGWTIYAKIIKRLGGDRELLLIDLDAVRIKSMAFHMPSPEDFSSRVMKILRRHNIKQISVVGHSFGSISAGWLVKTHPQVVRHLTLVDPVSLLLALPDVAYSFLYRKPCTIVEWIIYLMASSEITISHTLYRNFWWYKNVLWLEDVPPHIGVAVGVAEKDEITNATAICEYVDRCRRERIAAASTSNDNLTCEKNNSPYNGGSSVLNAAPIEFVQWQGYSHGQILLGGRWQRAFIEMVKKNENATQKLVHFGTEGSY